MTALPVAAEGTRPRNRASKPYADAHGPVDDVAAGGRWLHQWRLTLPRNFRRRGRSPLRGRERRLEDECGTNLPLAAARNPDGSTEHDPVVRAAARHCQTGATCVPGRTTTRSLRRATAVAESVKRRLSAGQECESFLDGSKDRFVLNVTERAARLRRRERWHLRMGVASTLTSQLSENKLIPCSLITVGRS